MGVSGKRGLVSVTDVGRARRKGLGDDLSKAGSRRPREGLGVLSPVTRENADRPEGRALISVLKASLWDEQVPGDRGRGQGPGD